MYPTITIDSKTIILTPACCREIKAQLKTQAKSLTAKEKKELMQALGIPPMLLTIIEKMK
jgi:hypothetical protein